VLTLAVTNQELGTMFPGPNDLNIALSNALTRTAGGGRRARRTAGRRIEGGGIEATNATTSMCGIKEEIRYSATTGVFALNVIEAIESPVKSRSHLERRRTTMWS